MAPNASKEPASERVIAAFVQLASSSKDLNDEIAQWAKNISALNEALRKLKIGASAWHTISSGGEDPEWNSREIGYAKIEDEWRIALRKRWGHTAFPEDDGEEIWPFEDAPRWFMLDAGGKIPRPFGDACQAHQRDHSKSNEEEERDG